MTTRTGLLRAWLLLFFAGLFLRVPVASGQELQLPPQSQLPPDVRRWLTMAARDSMLAPWKAGEFMQGLVRGTDDRRQVGPLPLPRSHATPGQADGDWLELVPSGRWGHTAVYDPPHDRMVVFGGLNEASELPNDVWALSLSGRPVWSTPAVPQPTGRYLHAAIYDPVRDRMVVFGGRTGYSSSLNDVWALSLSGTPTWTELTPAGTPPSTRWGHTAMYDPGRDRMVVFGGLNEAGNLLNDVWALSLGDTQTWSQLVPTGTPPPARSQHTAIYDPVRNRMVVFGGVHDWGDVWALSLDSLTWSQLTPLGSPPSGRAGHTAIYDPARDRMVVVGGGLPSDANYNDVWALSLTGSPEWSALAPAGTPPNVLWGHTAIYDAVHDRMVVFGGMNHLYSFPNEVWAVSLSGAPTWSTPVVPQSTGRFGHTAICDPQRDRMVVFGGFEWAGGLPNDVWALSLGEAPTWTQITPEGPLPTGRFGHTAIYDPLRDRMVVFGGFEWAGGLPNDLWALSLGEAPTWTQMTPEGPLPTGRFGHTAIYDPLRDRMVVFGGSDTSPNEVWALSLAGAPAWTQLTPAGTPPSIGSGNTVIYDPVRDRMVVFGGGGDPPNVWTLSLSGSPAWSQLTPLGTPPVGGPERERQTAIYDPVRDRIVGAWGSGIDVWALSLSGSPAWSELAPAGVSPVGRTYHTAIYDPLRDRTVVFGGVWQHLFGSDVWALTWGTPLLPPPTLAADVGPASITLHWTPSPSENVVGYRISYGPVHEAVRYSGDQATEGPSGIEVPATQTSLVLTCLPHSLFRLVVQAVGAAGGWSGWSQEVLVQVGPVVGTLAVHPMLHPRSNARWVTAVLEPQAGYSAAGLVWESLRLNEVVAPEQATLGDADSNGVMDLTLKFPRDEVLASLPQGEHVEVRVTGRLLGCRDTLSCTARDTIRLIQPRVTHPVADLQVASGAVVEIAWTLPTELAVDSVVVLVSVDNRRSWEVMGGGPAGWSVCEWTAPAGAAESCYVAVVAYGGGEEVGVGYGGPFRVTTPVAVVSVTQAFGLQCARPHPFRAGGRIVFGVPQASAVSLRVFDLRGRLVETLVDGPIPAGRHEVAWDAHGVASGVYFVQLRSEARQVSGRLVVAR